MKKLIEKKEALARISEGGTPERPIEVESASQVEAHARSLPCAACDGSVRIEEHGAKELGGARLRVVRLVCVRCGRGRVLFFRIASPLPN